MTPDKKHYLRSLYYNLDKFGSFRGPKALHDLVKSEGTHDISLAAIKTWLKGESVYTRFRPARREFGRNQIQPRYVGQIFTFDLMEFTEEPETYQEPGEKEPKTMRHALIGMDCFSCFGFCVPMEGRKSADAIKAVKFCLEKYHPDTALCDRVRFFQYMNRLSVCPIFFV